MSQSWTKERVLDEIRGLHKREGRLSSRYVQQYHTSIWSAGCTHFGNWGKAVKAAGFEYDSMRAIRKARKWSKGLVIVEIKKRHKAGLPLNMLAIQKEDSGLYQATHKLFGDGGWDNALRLAGIDPTDVTLTIKWKKEVVIAEIKSLALLGMPLYYRYLVLNGYERLAVAGRKRFGSWKKAIEAAGLDYKEIVAVQRGYWKPETILAEIKKLKRSGIRLSLKSMRQHLRSDLITVAIRSFGSWGQAVEAAGINYRDHCLIWSSKAWLRNMNQVDVTKLGRKVDDLIHLEKTRKRRKR